MNVVVHQNVSVYGDAMRNRGVREAIEIESAIVNAGKYRRAIVSTLDDVQDSAGKVEARLARHYSRMRAPTEARHYPKVGPETIFDLVFEAEMRLSS